MPAAVLVLVLVLRVLVCVLLEGAPRPAPETRDVGLLAAPLVASSSAHQARYLGNVAALQDCVWVWWCWTLAGA